MNTKHEEVMRVLCYVDNTDNTKNTLAAFKEETETRTDAMVDKVAEVLNNEFGMMEEFSHKETTHEIARQICYTRELSIDHGDYSFFFECCRFLG